MRLKIVEWFGGIGAATRALQNIGHIVEIIDYVEIDKHAVKSYNAIQNLKRTPKDLLNVDVSTYGEIDLLVAGFPCQDLSVAGKQKGLIESERSSLIWVLIKKISEMKDKPRFILLENVKGLLGKKHAEAFKIIQDEFINLGYKWSHKVLNAKHYGVPQNRERVYCVLSLDEPYNWDWSDEYNEVLAGLQKLIDMEEQWIKTKNYGKKYNYYFPDAKEKDIQMNSSYKRAWPLGGGIVGTVPASNPPKIAFIHEGVMWYRKLSALECFRLMGFCDYDYENCVKAGVSNSQLAKQAGNSIVVNVLEQIFRRIEWGEEEE